MNAFVIGHVGRFTNQKNHSKLIDIFAAIKERKSDAYLLLLGGGELQDTIKSKVEKLNLCDSVIFCGVRTDVNKYLYSFRTREPRKRRCSQIMRGSWNRAFRT